MDPRLTPATARVAHVSLKGKVNAPKFVEGEKAVASYTQDVFSTPGPGHNPSSSRVTQVLMGETITVLEYHKGNAFIVMDRDGYVGWIPFFYAQDDPKLPSATHVIAARSSHSYREPDIKSKGMAYEASFGERVHVEAFAGSFARIIRPRGTDSAQGPFTEKYIPAQHLRPINDPERDPAAVTERLLGTPYLWGGNTSFGVDCSGLVQLALIACGKPCPRDSDMQFNTFPAIEKSDLQRGDLVFWKGHVGMMLDSERLIHANAHHMAVAIEPLDDAIIRIGAKEFGDVTGYARP